MSKARLDARGTVALAPATAPQAPDGFPRIAYFTESLLPWLDGVSRTLGVLFDALEAQGRDFRIFAPIAPSADYAWSHRVVQVGSVPFLLYNDYRISVPHARRLEAELDAFAPDLIHLCSPTPIGFWAQAYARSRGIATVGSFHTHFAAYFGYYRFGFLRPLVWRLLRLFYGGCEATLAPSESMISELRERGIRNARLWTRGIDAQLFNPGRRDEALRAELGVDNDTALLLMVSRFVKEKDLLELIEADKVLARSGLKYRFAFVGDGPLRKRLEKGLPDAYFAGAKSGTELARWYASADIFVFPSTTETFGNVVQEAMASGIPAVVANSGGPPGLVVDGVAGLVAKAHDPADLAAKTASLIMDVDRRREMGRRGRELVEARTWDQVTNGLLRDYEAVRDRVRRRSARLRARSSRPGLVPGMVAYIRSYLRRWRKLAATGN